MAESRNNEIIGGLSGKLGKRLVFRQTADEKTIVAVAPRKSTKPPTEKQLAQREAFQQALLFGQKVIADPLMKEAYEAAAPPGKSGFNVAVADFSHAPNIVDVDVSAYTGQVGQQIRITVTDDFEVKASGVRIVNSNGILEEEGDAVQVGDSPEWIYTTNTTNTDTSGDKIIVWATDNPDNLTTKEIAL